MPNTNFGSRDILNMGDYNVSFYKCEHKYCKYSYSTWCPTCEKNSPRRRSKSETNEPCRRRCKEMKTFTPKKYARSREYENMEYEYDVKDGWYETKEPRLDCCRIRSNLCELPTSYISNNCQMPNNLTSIPKIAPDTNDFVECLKSVKTYEQTLKFVEYNNHLQNFGSNMQDKPKPLKHDVLDALHKVSPTKVVNDKSPINGFSKITSYNEHKLISRSKSNFYKYSLHSKSPQECNSNQNEMYNIDIKYHKDNHYGDFKNANVKNGFDVTQPVCRDYYCSIVDFKVHDLPDRSICYDTATYFDKRVDISNLQERYSKEVEFLREKLRGLKNSAYVSHVSAKVNLADNAEVSLTTKALLNHLAESNIKETVIASPMEIKQKVKERKVVSPTNRVGLLKNGKRVSVKTRPRVTSAKSRRLLPKPPKSASTGSECNESDGCSGSDESEHGEISDDDEESECVSEPSSSESSIKDSSEIPVLGVQPGAGDGSIWPVRPSLFPHIPPYIRFNSHDAEVPYKFPCGRKFFKWKLSTITPIVVRKTLINSGFGLVRTSNQWLGTWGKHMKSPMFKTLKDTQKLNHFPGTFQLGRKDRLWRNFQRLINKFGYKEFGFLPHTYVLPQELKLLKQNWEFKNGSGSEMWIIKPPASARGTGIRVINKWSQLPKKTSLVVQKYISNPYLINGSKFDLRLYVLVTSFHPLRIYMYPDGLARFASAKYSDDVKDLKDRYMHLTNYSINKLSSQYTANEDANACQGHKWTISKLLEYLHDQGVDTKVLWKNLQQLVIKTILTAEPPITQLCGENMNNLYNCYELFGVDVLLDEHLKPWLLEVNISPSLHSASPLDAHVKGPLVQTLFDMAQFNFPPRLAHYFRQSPQSFDPKLYSTNLTKKERNKHTLFTQYEHRDDYLFDILRDLTGDDVRHLTRAEDEYSVKGRFERIFPTSHTHKYLDFMETRYYNRLFDAWETKYSGRRQDGIALLQTLCAQRVHLKVAPQSTLSKNSQNTIPADTSLQPSKDNQSRSLEEIMQDTSITNRTELMDSN